MAYIWTDQDWLYLAVVLDLFNREVVNWSIKSRMTTVTSASTIGAIALIVVSVSAMQLR